MAVLRPYLIPTLGTPQAVVAPAMKRKNSNMGQSDFYSQMSQQGGGSSSNPQQQGMVYQTPQQTVTNRQRDMSQEFEPTDNTAGFLDQQLQNYANRTAPPMLEPGGRVKSANAELVQPDNFKIFYQQLDAITQKGNEALGTETARAAYKRLQAMQAIRDQEVPTFGGMPVGYKNPNAPYGGNGGVGGPAGGSLVGEIGHGLGLGGSPAANFRIAQGLAKQFGWGSKDIQAWYTLGMKESGWNANAQNPTSTAYGIGQFLDSTWGGYGIKKTSNPSQQVLAMARYIKARYGSPSNALAFHISHNWY